MHTGTARAQASLALNEVSGTVVDAAMKVHTVLGPGAAGERL